MTASNASHPSLPPMRPHTLQAPTEARVDEYYWMRERDAPEVRAYLTAENERANLHMQRHEGDTRALYDEMVARIQETDKTVETRDGDHVYYSRTVKGMQYGIQCRRRADDPHAVEEVILDPNEWAESLSYVDVGEFEVSPDGRWLAYTIDDTGFREYTLKLKCLDTGATSDWSIERITSVAWSADNLTLLATREDEDTKRSYQLLEIERDGGRYGVRLEEQDGRFAVAVGRTKDGQFFVVQTDSHTTSEVHLIPTDAPSAAPQLVLPRAQGIEYDVEHRRGSIFVRINDTGPNFRLVQTPMPVGPRDEWEELVEHRPHTMLSGVDVFAQAIVVHERRGGLGMLAVLPGDGSRRVIDFPDEVYEIYGGWNPDPAAKELRFLYESPRLPMTNFAYDFETGARTPLKQREVLGGFCPEDYVTRRLHAIGRDGTKIPISLVSRARRESAGSPQPLLLQGYGAYGYPYHTGFSSAQLSLLDRGVAIAIAHVRGGGELGKMWHEAGRMNQKMNTFRDFIDCADHLVEQRLTTRALLAIEGGSAGGLLVGSVLNMRPDLCHTAISQVPFVDVLTTMSDSTLPLTVGEYEEWGNPTKAEDYAYMRQYCPYTNLHEAAYPAMLVKASLHDSQVMYWEPAKYVARMRRLRTGDAPLLLQTNMAAGHGGASGRYDRLRETAFDYTFLLHELAVDIRAPSPAASAPS